MYLIKSLARNETSENENKIEETSIFKPTHKYGLVAKILIKILQRKTSKKGNGNILHNCKLCQVSSPKFKLPANGDEMKDASLVVKNMAELTKFPFRNILYSVETFGHENKSGDTTYEPKSANSERSKSSSHSDMDPNRSGKSSRRSSVSRNSPRKGTCRIYKTFVRTFNFWTYQDLTCQGKAISIEMCMVFQRVAEPNNSIRVQNLFMNT